MTTHRPTHRTAAAATAAARPLRAGLIGLGTMGGRHARILRTLPGVELVAAVDPHHAPAPDAGRLHAAEPMPILADLDELLALDIAITHASAYYLDAGQVLGQVTAPLLLTGDQS